MSEVLKRDANHVPVVGGITNDVSEEVRMLRVDPSTNRLLVSAVLPTGFAITSLNGLTASVQTFSVTDDDNVTLTISSLVDNHDFELGWTGQLGISRGGTNLSTIAAGSVLAANTLDTLTAITSTSGTKVLTNTDGTITWSVGGGGAVDSVTGTTNQVIASPTTGDVVLSTPQDIATASSPTFAGLTLTAFSGAVSASAGVLSAGTLSVANGGTNITTYTTGDILYSSASNVLSNLAGVATGNALISGGVSTAPSWGKIGLTTHISGTLAVGNGGTGSTSFTAGSVVFSNGTILTQDNSNLFWNDTDNRLGIGTTTPLTGLEVKGATAAGTLTLSNSDTDITTGEILGRLDFYTNDSGASAAGITGSILSTAALTHSSSQRRSDLAFYTANGTTLTEVMRILGAGGYMGLGTTAPSKLLQLEQTGGTTLGASEFLKLANFQATVGIRQEIGFGFQRGSALTYSSAVIGHISTSNTNNGTGDLYIATRSATTDTAPTERMRILSTGLIGIGTSAPTSLLTMIGGDMLIQQTSVAANIILDRTDGSVMSLSAGQLGGNFRFDDTLKFQIQALPRASILAGSGGGALNVVGVEAAPSDSLYINSSGNIGLGTSTISAKLDVIGDVEISTGSSTSRAKVSGVIWTDVVTANTTSTTEATLFTKSVPASTLANNGEAVTAEFHGRGEALTSATATVRVKFGSQTIMTEAIGNGLGATDASWTVMCTIQRLTSTTQYINCQFICNGSIYEASYDTYTAGTQTLSNANNIVVTGQVSATSGTSNRLTYRNSLGKWNPVGV